VDTKPKSEGLRLARLMMVLSGLSPLFVLWAIRGPTVMTSRRMWLFIFSRIQVSLHT
jgi:hypothetical protein